jgi:hypothetical protein
VSAFVTISIILATLALILGSLAVQHIYHTRRRGVGNAVAHEVKGIKDEDSKLTQAFTAQLIRGVPPAEAVADYKALRRKLIPNTAAVGLPDTALWDEKELATYIERANRDSLLAAKRSYNLHTALLLTFVVGGTGLANAGAYFFWFSRPAATATGGDEFEPVPSQVSSAPVISGAATRRTPELPGAASSVPPAPQGLTSPRPAVPGPSTPSSGHDDGPGPVRPAQQPRRRPMTNNLT